jgi:hypothetical protein
MKFGINSSTRASDQTDRLAITPLFHVQANGCPFMAQTRTG